MTHHLCLVELMAVNVQDALEEGVKHGAGVGDGMDVLLHVVPVSQTPSCL